MKKLMAMVLVLVTLCGSAAACELIPLEAAPGAFDECAGWAVVAWCKEVAGIKSPDEAVEPLPVQSVTGDYIRGFAKGGLIRVKASVGLLKGPDGWVGLHKVRTTVRISPDMLGIVSEIVDRRVGTEPSAASVIAATLWRMGDSVSHIFFTEEAAKVLVGTVSVHGESTPLWMGDFDGDGKMELGFTFGILEQIKKPEPEPEPEKPAPKPQEKPKAEPKPCEKQTVKVCWDFGFDLSVWFKGCVTLVKGLCGK